MKTSGIFWRIYRAYAIVIVFALGGALLLLRPSIYGFLKSEREEDSLDFLPSVIAEIQGFNTDLSNTDGLLGFPLYTTPREFGGEPVPDVLLSGNHAEIEKWRRKQQLQRTKRHRPDLFCQAELQPGDADLL